MELSETDRKILGLLVEDCRLSNAQLAEKASVSASTCWRRVQAMEAGGIISGYHADVEPARIGYGFSAIVTVKVLKRTPGQMATVREVIEKLPAVRRAFTVTGNANFILHIVVRDMAEFNDFLDCPLFELDGIIVESTSVITDTLKDSFSFDV